jgi:putative ABC transport system permease protein
MSCWLQHYPYHSGIPWWVIAGTALGALLITITVVSGQAVKAAVANPVRSLGCIPKSVSGLIDG